MVTSSADPGQLDAYLADLQGPADGVARATGDLEDALTALRAQVRSGYRGGFPTTVPSGHLTRVRDLDATVATVAQRFRAADSSPGVVTVDDSVLGAPLTPVISPERRAELAEEAADEYANLAEDDDDPTTAAELAGYLAVIRAEIEAAGEGLPPDEAFEAQKDRAEELLHHAGPRDLRVALEMIGDGVEAGGADQEQAEATLADLGLFTSLGLDDDPTRAQRWIAVLEEEWDWDGSHGDDTERGELLALLATQVDTRTRTFGEEIFWRVFEDPWHPDLDNDILEAVAGDSSVFTVLFGGLADSPRLANAIVDRGILLADEGGYLGQRWVALLDARYDGFENGGDGRGDDSDDARYQQALADLLTAATHEDLPLEDSVPTALALLDYADRYAGNDEHYVRFSAPVREAFGRTIGPLLDAWLAGDAGSLAVPGDPPIPLPPEAFDQLQDALDRIARDPDASAGLLVELTDFTRDEIHAAVAAGDDEPFSELGVILLAVIGGSSSTRYHDLIGSVEGGGAQAGFEAVAVELLSLVKFANLGTLAKAGYRGLRAYYGSDVPGGGNQLPPFFTSFVRSELLLAHLDAGTIPPDPALEAAIEAAAEQGGYPALEDLLLNPDDLARQGVSAETIAALDELEDRIEDEKQRISPELVQALDDIFSQ